MHDKSSMHALGTEPIGKLLVRYSVPAVIAMTATSIYNIIDSIFIGRGVGPLAISGLAVTLPLMNLVIAFCTLISIGGATISSIYIGQKDKKAAEETLKSVSVFCIIHSFIVGILALIFLRPILSFFGATPGTIEYAIEFMQVILLGSPITFVFIGLNNIMRATGYPRKAMITALISVFVNIILAPIFIFSFDWGIRGAAFATVISQLVGLVWILYHFMQKKSFVHFNKGTKWINLKIIGHIYGIGLSPFLINIFACVVVIFINRALLYTSGENGDLAIGAFGIINRTVMVLFMVVFGVAQGMQPILGYNYGSKKIDRVKMTLKKGMLTAFIITTIGFVLSESFPHALSALFTSDQTLIDIATTGYRIVFIFWPVVGIQIIIQNFFQSIGKPKISILLSMMRQIIFLVPLLIILPIYLGTNGVWWSIAISDLLAFLITIGTWYYQRNRLQKDYVRFSE